MSLRAELHAAVDEVLERHGLRDEPADAPADDTPADTERNEGPRLSVMVDAGHGGNDPGAVAGGVKESDLVLPYALELRRELTRRGHVAATTRSDDRFLELGERARLANAAGADAFISFHANASGRTEARGAWMLHAAPSAAGRRLAEALAREVGEVQGVAAVAVHPDGAGWTGGRTLAVLRRTAMPAVLVELGFLTNPEDRAFMQRADARAAMVQAIADGLEAWGRPIV